MYDKSIETIVNDILSDVYYYSSGINKIISSLVDIQSDVENLVSFYYERKKIE